MKLRLFALTLAFAGILFANSTPTYAQTAGTPVFDSIPSPTPPNVPSEGFQCCQNAEFGDMIKLEGDTPRRAGYLTILMSSWAKNSTYPSMGSAGFSHPVTLSLYATTADAAARHAFYTVTKSFTMEWRPEADPSCTGGRWKASDGNCYNGFAFTITFDLRAANVDLPDQFVYGIAYNTNTWGYNPIGQPGPYESLNIGLSTVVPTVGDDVTLGELYRSSYNGAGGFVPESDWETYIPAVQFTTFAMPTTTASCKNGAWQNLVRSDFSSFKNQGACVSYVNTGK